jgi:hypothetical protein
MKKPNLQPFKIDFVPTSVCFKTHYLHKIYFLVKIQLFVTTKYEQDPATDPHGSVLILLPGSGSRSKLR